MVIHPQSSGSDSELSLPSTSDSEIPMPSTQVYSALDYILEDFNEHPTNTSLENYFVNTTYENK